MEYAQVHQISALEELFRYLIHGILHLIGYNDLTSKERALMRRKETALLKRLKMARLLKNGS
jgi:probable rRNA maturation factor